MNGGEKVENRKKSLYHYFWIHFYMFCGVHNLLQSGRTNLSEKRSKI